MSLEPESVNWRTTIFLTLVFFAVSGACLGTHYTEHGFQFLGWLTEVAFAGTMPGVFFGMALAIRSLAVAAGVMLACLAGAVGLFIYRTEALVWFVMGPGIPRALVSFVGGRLFRERSMGAGQFGLRTLFLLPVVVATVGWLIWLRAALPLAAVVVAVAAVATALAGYRLTVETPPSRGQRWRDSLLLTVGCLYLPFSWLLLIDYSWDGYRLGWLATWPVLPGGVGLLPLMFLGVRPTDGVGLAIVGLTTLGLIAVFGWIAQRGRWATVVAALAALATAGWTALGVHAIFRA